jgi:hypothetical protein
MSITKEIKPYTPVGTVTVNAFLQHASLAIRVPDVANRSLLSRASWDYHVSVSSTSALMVNGYVEMAREDSTDAEECLVASTEHWPER